MILYTLYDKKACAHSRPYHSANRSTMLRELAQGAKAPDSYLATHPDDFHAVVVGSFDEIQGVITPCQHEVVSIPREVK